MVRYLFILVTSFNVWCTSSSAQDANTRKIYALINDYSKARENRDTILLKSILTEDVDQLVSTGEWRYGLRAAIQGMMESSTANPGSRTLTVEKLRYMEEHSAIADARYEISNPDGTVRRMWSSFIVVHREEKWKITAIRNMLPTGMK
jgi:uncharacterized protein (TIGR02246 family)